MPVEAAGGVLTPPPPPPLLPVPQAAMRDLSTEFVEYASGYSVTEVAAWCEVCRQLGFEGDAQGAMCEAGEGEGRAGGGGGRG